MKIRVKFPQYNLDKIETHSDGSITLAPIFYKRIGWVPFIEFTTIEENGEENNFCVSVGAASKTARLEVLKRVIPKRDIKSLKQTNEDADISRPPVNPIS